MELVYCIRIPNRSTNSFFRLKTIWNGNNLEITLLDQNNAYRSKVNENELKSLSKKFRITFTDYVAKLKSSLCKTDNDTFEYDVQKNNLVIYKHDSKMKVKCASFVLETINYEEASENMIDDLLKMNSNYKKQIQILEEEKENISKAQKLSEKNLKDFVKLKEETEQTLYSNFILLLNEKKKRIQYLQELLTRYKTGEVLPSDDETCSDDSTEIDYSSNVPQEYISNSESENTSDEEAKTIITEAKVESTVVIEENDNTQEILPDTTCPIVLKRRKVDEDNIIGSTQNVENEDNDFVEECKLESSEEMDFNTQDILNKM